jgi:hypothetical protein
MQESSIGKPATMSQLMDKALETHILALSQGTVKKDNIYYIIFDIYTYIYIYIFTQGTYVTLGFRRREGVEVTFSDVSSSSKRRYFFKLTN